MRWRAVAEADLLECLALEPRNLGEEIVGPEAARVIWRDLVRNLSFNSGVFSDIGPDGQERILGFGACVFVKPDFADRELTDPRPCMNSRIFASIAAGKSVLLPSTELYSPRGGDGLDVAILFGNYHGTMRPEQLREVQRLLPSGFAEVLRGYRLNRLLNETVGDVQREFVQSSGVWRVVHTLTEERVLFVMTREEAYSASGSLAAGIFIMSHLRSGSGIRISNFWRRPCTADRTANLRGASISLCLPSKSGGSPSSIELRKRGRTFYR